MSTTGASNAEREVAELSDVYEAALLRHDIDVMNAMFWDDPRVLRFGIADMQVGFDELVDWRRATAPIDPLREVTGRRVVALAPGVVAVDLTFADGPSEVIGRQSQTWVHTPNGWRIARAHVSLGRHPPAGRRTVT